MTIHSITLTVPYTLAPSRWEALLKVYKAMSGWTDSARDGCPFWWPDGPKGGEIFVSVEPSGLLFEGNVSKTTWDVWMADFSRRATSALGFVVRDADD